MLRDFQNCDEQLVPGGLILFDDSTFLGVNRVIERIERDDRYEVVAPEPQLPGAQERSSTAARGGRTRGGHRPRRSSGPRAWPGRSPSFGRKPVAAGSRCGRSTRARPWSPRGGTQWART